MLPIHHHLTDDHIYLNSVLKMRNSLAEDTKYRYVGYHLMKSYKHSLPEDQLQRSELDFTVEFLNNTSILINFFLTCNLYHVYLRTVTDTRVSNLVSVLR